MYIHAIKITLDEVTQIVIMVNLLFFPKSCKHGILSSDIASLLLELSDVSDVVWEPYMT